MSVAVIEVDVDDQFFTSILDNCENQTERKAVMIAFLSAIEETGLSSTFEEVYASGQEENQTVPTVEDQVRDEPEDVIPTEDNTRS